MLSSYGSSGLLLVVFLGSYFLPTAQSNKALQLTARQHVSQVTYSFSLNAARAPQLKASVGLLLF
jgi:hypothetical protein